LQSVSQPAAGRADIPVEIRGATGEGRAREESP